MDSFINLGFHLSELDKYPNITVKEFVEIKESEKRQEIAIQKAEELNNIAVINSLLGKVFLINFSGKSFHLFFHTKPINEWKDRLTSDKPIINVGAGEIAFVQEEEYIYTNWVLGKNVSSCFEIPSSFYEEILSTFSSVVEKVKNLCKSEN